MTLMVNEIFYSIQGESSHQGRRCIFVRLTGCHLRCRYCDSSYAFTEGILITIEDIITQIQSFSCKLVEITGGEPLIQKGVYDLMQKLLDLNYEVLLETSGTIDLSNVPRQVKKIVDVKTPASGECSHHLTENMKRLELHDELKFVICDKADFDWAVNYVLTQKLDFCKVWFSPLQPQVPYDLFASWLLQTSIDVSLHIQLHKLIWPRIDRGV